jgi:hypothetical protein
MKGIHNSCMNSVALRVSRLATGSLWAVALGVCFSLPGIASGSDCQTPHPVVQSAGRDFHFDESITISRGEQSALAVHRSGLIVSVFRNFDPIFGKEGKIVYRIGKIHGSHVAWGQIQETDAKGFWPAVAISKEGYVIIVHNNRATKNHNPDLFYQVGWIDPNGHANQTITMKTDLIPWDAGHNVGIAMNMTVA